MKKYSISEIKKYLEGWCLVEKEGEFKEENAMLQNAITYLEDYEDGIEAVIERIHGYENELGE